jgi:hypothetical protein
MPTHSSDRTLYVASPMNRPADGYDPAKIYNAVEYVFLENIYSTLVEFSPSGELVPGIAESFGWVQNELVLNIRKDLKTASGHSITPQDVEASLKRLLILASNTHGNWAELICQKEKIVSIEQSCIGIRVDGDAVVLSPGKKLPFLLQMLAAMDFAVIPKSSLNKELKIFDYKNTSGPYYVEKDDLLGSITLKANKTHYRYHPNMPHEIKLVPAIEKDSLSLFKENQIDLITTVDNTTEKTKFQKFIKENSDINIHKTMNIKSIAAIFTEAGLKKYSRDERLAFGNLIRETLEKEQYSELGLAPALQFLPLFGEGALSEEEESNLRAEFKKLEPESQLPKRMKIGLSGKSILYMKPVIEKAFPDSTVTPRSTTPEFSDFDVLIYSIDSGFMEDISLVTYAINFGIFGSVPEGKKWLTNYMNIESKEERIHLLKELHFDALNSGTLIPIFHTYYKAIARKPWSLGLSKFYANNPFYYMRYEQD